MHSKHMLRHTRVHDAFLASADWVRVHPSSSPTAGVEINISHTGRPLETIATLIQLTISAAE
jgi:hypothetical protein